jgi:hypothetical protein
MISMLNRGARAAILAIAVLALGCESGTEPGRTPALGVDARSDLIEETLGSTLSAANRAVAQLSDEVVREKIGKDGGELTLLGNTLTVPAGAVDRPTMFVLSVLAGDSIQVELIAYDPELYEDVGGKGFGVPVTLALSYAEAEEDLDPETLTIVHIKTDGEPVVLESTVDTENEVVSADLSHFSRYALCSN